MDQDLQVDTEKPRMERIVSAELWLDAMLALSSTIMAIVTRKEATNTVSTVAQEL
jgi:hypothetical protein